MADNTSIDNLDDLYQDIVLEHSMSPRNFLKIANPTCATEGYNPLCGDHLTLYLSVEGDRIVDVGFEGSGCAISKASASVMGEAIKGKTIAEAQELFGKFHSLVTTEQSAETVNALGDLAAFSGVRAFPVRVKCATLAWHALQAALKGEAEKVSTE